MKNVSNTTHLFLTKADSDLKLYKHTGDALKITPEMNEVFDLVFIDAEKASYDAYLKPL